MNRTANKSMLLLVCLLVMVFLQNLGFPSRAEAVQMVSFTSSKSEVAHGEDIAITISFSVFIPTAEGTTSASLYVYRNGEPFSNIVIHDYLNSIIANKNILLWELTNYTYTIPAENVDSYLFTWTASANINGTEYQESGSASIRVLHDYGPWAHNDTTSGADSKHKKTCICGREEENPCSFASTVTSPTCTEDGFTTHTCSVCDYSYQSEEVSATEHAWGAWSHDAGTAEAASLHIRVCGNNPVHIESDACVFSSVVTPPTCTEDGFTTFTCTECGYSYTDASVNALGHTEVIDPAVPATCTVTGLTSGKHCPVCKEVLIPRQVIPALGHLEGGWEVTVSPTNRKTGTQVKRCTRCGVIIEAMKIPVLSMVWPDNTACSFGLRFRDELPELTDKWYMYTPLDLTAEGILEVPLIASNRYRIGTTQVTVKNGQVSASYEVTADKVEVKEEFMTFLPGLEELVSVEPVALADRAVPFGTSVDIASLGKSGQALFFMRLVVTYDIYADGVQWWSMP